ncbi:DUF4181 domain-containing protein [Virgibacillus sp. C22-A2]|uniref:DUF4181 domain-containing protein n=1 Tax=Virgibacillus tibetensis TaxID=3042313 RepID=A0ABU6KIN5_9BACI|nr:DUF4181 domain-containing protein [Virgibacillus sp. C22-A2]
MRLWWIVEERGVLLLHGTEPIFWLKLILALTLFALLLIAFNAVMSKWLKVEKKKFFSYNHVNEKHKKVDWIIRITFTARLGFMPIIY